MHSGFCTGSGGAGGPARYALSAADGYEGYAVDWSIPTGPITSGGAKDKSHNLGEPNRPEGEQPE
jgi:hypothetical protein